MVVMPIHYIINFPLGFNLFSAVKIPLLLSGETKEIASCLTGLFVVAK